MKIKTLSHIITLICPVIAILLIMNLNRVILMGVTIKEEIENLS